MFSTIPKANFNFLATFTKSAANALDLEWFKILSFGKEKVENINGKRRKCWLPAFSPFTNMFSKPLSSQDCLKSGLCGAELAFPTQALVFTCLEKESTENTMGNGLVGCIGV